MAVIVVADDDRMTRTMIRSTLEAAGHTVLDAEDGYECLERVSNARPDLVFVDVFMPEMDGLQTLAEIHREYPNLKIVGMSSGGTRGQMTFLGAMRDLGALHVITKPIRALDLMVLVDRLTVS